MKLLEAVFSKKTNKEKPSGDLRLCQRRGNYISPPCRTLTDLARLMLDDEPSQEYIAGFVGCLAALEHDPRCFLEVAWRVRGGWNAYHALDEVGDLCGPAVREFVRIVNRALFELDKSPIP